MGVLTGISFVFPKYRSTEGNQLLILYPLRNNVCKIISLFFRLRKILYLQGTEPSGGWNISILRSDNLFVKNSAYFFLVEIFSSMFFKPDSIFSQYDKSKLNRNASFDFIALSQKWSVCSFKP